MKSKLKASKSSSVFIVLVAFLHLTLLLPSAFCATIFNFNKNSTYEENRNKIIESEISIRTGGNVYLNPREKEADKILLSMKEKAVQRGIEDPSNYAPSLHFFHAKSLIDDDPIFKIIKQLPKGGNLHVHNSASVSSEWVIKNLTYRDDVRICTNKNGLKIFIVILTSKNCVDEPISITKLRSEANNIDDFDKSLESLINLYTLQPHLDYPDINTVWKRFQSMFTTIDGLLDYAPIYKAYHYRLLEELYEDNVQYVELRSGFSGIVDENDKKMSSKDVIELLIKLVDDFKLDHPQFLGMKAILTVRRDLTQTSTIDKMKRFTELHQSYPNFVIGFDLVGQEDIGKPLSEYVDKLKDLSQNGLFFFHAGETNWYNTEADCNLIDAILMNTKRIGHGYSLYKHPILWEEFRKKNIAVEINAISNQVLGLVHDLRNHPAAFYISENVPIVISNDDPGFWGGKGLSYDFYYAFMAFSPADAGLQLLKQLAWNSFKYSGLNNEEKLNASIMFKSQWEKFIDYLLKLM